MREKTTDLDIERAIRGDLAAFQRLVERHSSQVFGLAFKLTCNADDADDVVQETFIKVWKKLGSFDGSAAFGTWLYRIASNSAIDLLRRRSRRQAHQESYDGSSTVIPENLSEPGDLSAEGRVRLNHEFPRELGQALDELTRAERTIFVLRHLEERSLNEIGNLLGLKTNAAKQTLFRAVRKIRTRLEPLAGSMEATR